LHAILEAETSMPATAQLLIHNGSPLVPGRTLASQGVHPGDLIMLNQAQQAASRASPAPSAHPASPFSADGSALNPDSLMAQLRADPAQLAQLLDTLRSAVAAGDAASFQRELRQMAAARGAAAAEEERLYRMAAADPFNVEVQQRLEEIIQQRNVAENFESAMEHNPEVFGDVVRHEQRRRAPRFASSVAPPGCGPVVRLLLFCCLCESSPPCPRLLRLPRSCCTLTWRSTGSSCRRLWTAARRAPS
jgi:DNA damage-inducible protein 1